jgi:3-oxoadipate enol-lactonase
MPELKVTGAVLAYEAHIKPGRPWLVLSNSLGTNLSMWDRQVSDWAPHFSILRYDSRGHGQSSVPAGPYNISMLANDVVALADSLQIETFHFCGLSMGGMVGQWLGIHAANRIDKLVLCNTAAKIGTEDGWNERIAKVQSDGMASITEAVLQRWFSAGFEQNHMEVVARARAMLLSTSPVGYAASCAAIRDMDLRSHIHSIRSSTCVLYGEFDPVTTSEDAQLLASSIPSAQRIKVPTAHLSNLESPELFSASVLNFLLEN